MCGHLAEVAEVDPVDVPLPDPAQPGAQAVDLAADAEPGGRGEQREPRYEQAERPAGRLEAEQRAGARPLPSTTTPTMFANRGGRRVLDRTLAEARLHELEVGQAGQAPAAAERQPERELEREQRRAAATLRV